MKTQDYEKTSASLRGWLLGKEYFTAVKAMEFAKLKHIGVRKDKVTPEFQHQISIANFVRTLHHNLLFPEETFSGIMCHDVKEDYDVTDFELIPLIGDLAVEAVELVTNKYANIKKDAHTMYTAISRHPIASVIKGADRIHNIQTMAGVFSQVKQLSYITETEDYILPMLKQARKLFPEQENIYQNIRHVLLSQIELLRSVHSASTEIALIKVNS